MAILIIFAGKAGTGKSTLSRIIAKEEKIAYLDYDTLNQSFLTSIESKIGFKDADRYGFYREWRAPCYSTLLNTAIENLELGISVIISAPLTKELQDSSFPNKLKSMVKNDFSLLLFYMAPSFEQHKKMISERKSIRDEDFLNNEGRFIETLSPEKPKWDEESTVILTSSDIEINKEIVLKRVKALRRNI